MTCKHIQNMRVGSNQDGESILWCARCGRLTFELSGYITPSPIEVDLSDKTGIYDVDVVKQSIPDGFGNFGENPEMYINILNGDAMIIWWAVNRPTGKEWILVSKKCYDIHIGR